MNFDKIMTEKQKDRFWNSVDIRGDDECWLWSGNINRPEEDQRAVGQFSLDGKLYAASRVAWSLEHQRAVPDDLLVCHHCDTPRCMNIMSHTFLGTQKDNMDDAVQKGRTARGTGRPEAKLDDIGVLLCRHAYVNGLMGTVEMARRCGVAHSTMSYAVNGKQWKHLPMPEASKERDDG